MLDIVCPMWYAIDRDRLCLAGSGLAPPRRAFEHLFGTRSRFTGRDVPFGTNAARPRRESVRTRARNPLIGARDVCERETVFPLGARGVSERRRVSPLYAACTCQNRRAFPTLGGRAVYCGRHGKAPVQVPDTRTRAPNECWYRLGDSNPCISCLKGRCLNPLGEGGAYSFGGTDRIRTGDLQRDRLTC